MDYIDSQTYASNTLNILDTLESFASTTELTRASIELLVENQGEMTALIENTVKTQLYIIIALIFVATSLLIYILRQPLDRALNKFRLCIVNFGQTVKNWDTDKKLTNIILPTLIGMFLVVFGLVCGFIFGRISSA